MVTVTTEALEIVKRALMNFKTDVTGMAGRSSNKAVVINSECREHISRTRKVIEELEQVIYTLTQKITELEMKMKRMREEIENIRQLIPKLQSSIRSLESEERSIDSEISYLYSQKSQAEDGAQDQIQQQIDYLKQQSRYCREQADELRMQVRNYEEQRVDLEEKLKYARNEKTDCENELAFQRNRCNKYKDKLERLNMAYMRVESEMSSYLACMKKIESDSTGRAEENANAVDKCLTYIENYLDVSL